MTVISPPQFVALACAVRNNNAEFFPPSIFVGDTVTSGGQFSTERAISPPNPSRRWASTFNGSVSPRRKTVVHGATSRSFFVGGKEWRTARENPGVSFRTASR